MLWPLFLCKKRKKSTSNFEQPRASSSQVIEQSLESTVPAWSIPTKSTCRTRLLIKSSRNQTVLNQPFGGTIKCPVSRVEIVVSAARIPIGGQEHVLSSPLPAAPTIIEPGINSVCPDDKSFQLKQMISNYCIFCCAQIAQRNGIRNHREDDDATPATRICFGQHPRGQVLRQQQPQSNQHPAPPTVASSSPPSFEMRLVLLLAYSIRLSCSYRLHALLCATNYWKLSATPKRFCYSLSAILAVVPGYMNVLFRFLGATPPQGQSLILSIIALWALPVRDWFAIRVSFGRHKNKQYYLQKVVVFFITKKSTELTGKRTHTPSAWSCWICALTGSPIWASTYEIALVSYGEYCFWYQPLPKSGASRAISNGGNNFKTPQPFWYKCYCVLHPLAKSDLVNEILWK